MSYDLILDVYLWRFFLKFLNIILELDSFNDSVKLISSVNGII